MADVTISQLSQITPNNGALLPISQGGVTYSVAPSALLINSGNVGIGTSSPLYKLDIRDNSNVAGINVEGTQDNVAIRLNNNQTGGRSYRIISTALGSGYGAGSLAFEDSLGVKMIINSSGAVTKPNQPAFAIQAVQRQYNYNTSNWSKITGLSAINQNNINANSSFDFVNSRYIAPVGGIYHISGMLRLDPSPSSWLYIVPHINGVGYYETTGALPSLNVVYPPTGFAATNLSMLIKLNTNDILEFYFGASNNNTYTIYPQTCFYGYLLG